MNLVDAHVHFDSSDLADRMLADQWRMGAHQFNILVIGRDHPGNGTLGSFKQAQAIWFKKQFPDRVFAFGGLDYGGIIDRGEKDVDIPLRDQVDAIINAGFDGLKMLAGKPDARKRIGHALDSDFFKPLLDRLEETRFPLLWHVSDPPEFWDANAVPLWAKKHRWWYDNTHPPRAQIEAEMSRVLKRHPRLNIILPHFYFLSDDLSVATKFLEEHPNVNLDLTPGVEMFHNFTRQWDAAHKLFTRFADRIIFGTDIGMMNHGTGPMRGWMVRHFLESDETFDVPDDIAMTPDERPALRGLGLPKDVLKPIFAENFYRVLGRSMPLPIINGAAREMLKGLASRAAKRGESTAQEEIALKAL